MSSQQYLIHVILYVYKYIYQHTIHDNISYRHD